MDIAFFRIYHAAVPDSLDFSMLVLDESVNIPSALKTTCIIVNNRKV